MPVQGSGQRAGFQPALTACALIAATASAALVMASRVSTQTTYAASSALATLSFFLPGLALAVASAGQLSRRGSQWRTAAAVAAIAWLAPFWVGWSTGPELVRSVAMLVAPFVAPAMLHLAVAFEADPSARWRAVSAAGYAIVAGLSLVRGLVRNPFLDRYCWDNCTDNSFLVAQSPGAARRVSDALLLVSVLICVGAAAVAAHRLQMGTPVARAQLWLVLVSVIVAAAAEGAYAVLRLLDPAETADKTSFRAVFYARVLTLGAVAAGLGWTLLARARRRRKLERLAFDLVAAPPPAWLRDTLARSLNDPSLDIAFAVPGQDRYVDADGNVTDPKADGERATTVLSRRGHPVAVIRYDRALRLDQDAVEQIGAAARLAIDNERLRAALLATLEDVRASRRRIVAAGDEARRSLERNLHDGAQQRLLAAGFAMRLAARDAAGRGDADVAARLTNALHEVQTTLAELREVAHGIFPAVLDEAGLPAALETLAESSTTPVRVDLVPETPLPQAAAAATYFLVRATIDAADGAALDVSVHADNGRLLVRIDGARAESYVHVADRIGALGGELRIRQGHVEAELPCE